MYRTFSRFSFCIVSSRSQRSHDSNDFWFSCITLTVSRFRLCVDIFFWSSWSLLRFACTLSWTLILNTRSTCWAKWISQRLSVLSLSILLFDDQFRLSDCWILRLLMRVFHCSIFWLVISREERRHSFFFKLLYISTRSFLCVNSVSSWLNDDSNDDSFFCRYSFLSCCFWATTSCMWDRLCFRFCVCFM